MLELAKSYGQSVEEEATKTQEKFIVDNVGKIDAKKRLGEDVDRLMASNITQCLGTMMDTVVL